MCNCQCSSNFGFNKCFCLPAISAPSRTSRVESAAGPSTSVLGGHNQELPNMPSGMRLRDPSSLEVKLEVASDSHEDAATTNSTDSPSLFSKLTDAGPVADDHESVVPSIHGQFRQLAVGPVFPVIPVIPPDALQAHNALMARLQTSPTPANQSQSSLPVNGTPASDPTDVSAISTTTSATSTNSMLDAWLEQTMSSMEHDSSFQAGFQHAILHVDTTKAPTGHPNDKTDENIAKTPNREDDEGSDAGTVSSIKWSNPDDSFNRVEDEPDYITDTDSAMYPGSVVYSLPDLNFNRVQDEEGYETDTDSAPSGGVVSSNPNGSSNRVEGDPLYLLEVLRGARDDNSERPRDSEHSDGIILTHPDTPFHRIQARVGYLSREGLGNARDGHAERPREEQEWVENQPGLRPRGVEDLSIGVLLDILGALQGRVQERRFREGLAEAQEAETWRFD